LNCKIRVVKPGEEAHRVIMNFIKDSGSKNEVVDIFELEREGEKNRYNTKIGND